MSDASDAGWILVTNDDGIDASGIQILARALVRSGHSVKVIAPDENYSGASASLGSLSKKEPVPSEPRELPGLEGTESIAVAAPPAGCTMLGVLGGFADTAPTMVVSGINAGANAGRAIVFSGTIGAAQAGAVLGVPGIAVSLAESDSGDALSDVHYEVAAELAVELVDAVLGAPSAAPLTYNLNVPSLARSEMRGITGALPAKVGTMQTTIRSVTDVGIETDYVESSHDVPPDSDSARLRDGWATVSVIGRPEAFDAGPIVEAMLVRSATTS